MDQETELGVPSDIDDDSCNIPLSPIIEIHESSAIGSTISDDLSESLIDYLQDQTPKYVAEADSIDVISENNHKIVEVEGNRASSAQPGTPPEILRKRLTNLQSQFEYLSSEYAELQEFTQLEKQVHHNNCIPKVKVKSLEDEFNLVNEKVQHLIQENSDFKDKLEQTEMEKKDVETKLMQSLCLRNAVKKTATQIGQKLTEHLQDCIETVNKYTPTPKYFREIGFEEIEEPLPKLNCESTENCLEGIENLVGQFIYCIKKLNMKIEALHLSNEELFKDKERLTNSLQELEKTICLSKSEKKYFQQKLSAADLNQTSLLNTLFESQNKVKEVERLLEISDLEKQQLQNEIENLRNIITADHIQGKVCLALKEFEKNLISWDLSSRFEDLFVMLQEDKKVHSSIDFIFNSNMEFSNIFFTVLQTIRTKLNMYDKERNQLYSTVGELNNKVRQFEIKSRGLKVNVGELEYQVRELSNRVNEYESVVSATQIEKTWYNDKFALMELEMKELVKALSISECKLRETVLILENTNSENFQLEKQMYNLRNCITNDLHKELYLVLNELERFIDSWEGGKKFEDVYNMFQDNTTLFSSISLLKESHLQTNLFQILNKLKVRLNLCNKEKDQLLTKVENLNNSTQHFEGETIKLHKIVDLKDNENTNLRDKICSMDIANKELLSEMCIVKTKLKETESLLEKTNNDKDTFQKEIEKFNHERIRIDDLREEFKLFFYKIENVINSWPCTNQIKESFVTFIMDEKLPLLNILLDSKITSIFCQVSDKFKMGINLYEERIDKLNKTVGDLNQTVCDLNKYIETAENDQLFLKKAIKALECENITLKQNILLGNNKEEGNKYMDDGAGELKSVKELMIQEITSLDCDESKDALTSYSLVELFYKLMQNIMRKEGEISLDLDKQYKRDFERTQELLDEANNKLKSQESWIEVLECDNDKINKELAALKEIKIEMEHKIKMLSLDFRCASKEIPVLKSKILELATENDKLNADFNVYKNLVKTEKASVESLQNKLFELTAEVNSKSNLISSVVSKSYGSPVVKNELVNENNSVGRDDKQFCSNPRVPLEHSNFDYFEGNINELREEKYQLKNFLMHSSCNLKLSKELFKFSDKFVVLKDVVQDIAKKLSEIESYHAINVNELQTNIDLKTQELNNLKLSIENLFTEFDLDNKNLENDISSLLSTSIFNCDNISVKTEVKQMRNECVYISNCSKKLAQSSKLGHYMLQSFREELKILKNDCSTKELELEDLYKSRSHQKMEIDITQKEVNTLKENNALLENKVKDLKSQISNFMSILYEFQVDFPVQSGHTNVICNYLSEIMKQHLNTKDLILNLNEDIRFFSDQREIMNLYISFIEEKLYFAEEENKGLLNELNSSKKQFSATCKYVEEVNLFLSHLISKAPVKISSFNQASKVIQNIFDEYCDLNNTVTEFKDKVKVKQEQLIQQQKDLESMKKINSSLKSELAKCEDCIRNLRSELRSMRRQYQKKEGSSKCCPGLTETGIQTECLCCNELQEHILKKEKLLEVQNSQIASLEQQVQQENYPHKRKVSHLEKALAQAKERIKTLKSEVTQQRNINEDLIEVYEYQKEFQEK